MKLISVTILLTCLLAATFSNWLMTAAYELNTTYITKNFCVNKSMPSMHCNGKCYLAKQLQQSQQPATSNTAKEKFEIQLFCYNNTGISFFVTAANQQPYGFQGNLHSYLYSNTCFHPPCNA